MKPKQIIRVHAVSGDKDVVADRVTIENDEYILLYGDEEVRRIPIADTISGIDPETGERVSELETIFSCT